MKKKNIKENIIVKWILFLALIFGAIVYGAQPDWFHTIGAIFMAVLAVKFYIEQIRKKK